MDWRATIARGSNRWGIDRPRRCRILFLFCAILAAGAATGEILAMDGPSTVKVFASYWGSGRAASLGLDPYAQTPVTASFDLGGLRIPELNLNPPILLPLFQLLARLDLTTAARLFGIASTLAFLGAAAALRRCAPDLQRRQVIWLFAAPAFLDTLSLGQVYVGLMALSVAGWLALGRGRPVAAGAAIGALVAIKPIFMLWPIVLWCAGHRRPATVAVAAALMLTALSLALSGPQTALRWVAALAADRHALVPTDASLGGFLARLGLPRLGLAAGAGLALGTVAWAWRQRPGALDASGVGLAVAILAAPLSWFHYTLVLVPALLARPWGQGLSLAALLLCVPEAVPLSALDHPGVVGAALGAVYVTAVALIAVTFLRRASARHRRGVGVAEPASGAGIAAIEARRA